MQHLSLYVYHSSRSIYNCPVFNCYILCVFVIKHVCFGRRGWRVTKQILSISLCKSSSSVWTITFSNTTVDNVYPEKSIPSRLVSQCLRWRKTHQQQHKSHPNSSWSSFHVCNQPTGKRRIRIAMDCSGPWLSLFRVRTQVSSLNFTSNVTVMLVDSSQLSLAQWT